MKTFKQTIRDLFAAAYPGVAVQSTEEARVIAEVIAAAELLKKSVATWSVTEGLKKLGEDAIEDTQDLSAACRQRIENCVYIFQDAQIFPIGGDRPEPVTLRSIKDLLKWCPGVGSSAVFLGCEFRPHASIANLITVLDFDLPTAAEYEEIARGVSSSNDLKLKVSEEIVQALSGLTTAEAENACSLSVIEAKKFDPEIISREKISAVKKSGLLEIIPPEDPGSVGGLENLKEYIGKRKNAFSKKAIEFGLPAPKGILLVGVPGSGKSLTAKTVGSVLGLPTVRLDVGSLYNSLVGESESRTRGALKVAEAVAPCVLWLDEIDKGLAGSQGGGSSDSGVTRRVFGTIISWMQERRRPVFLVATANQVETLPAEILRKGRFDEIFSIDLPSDAERRAITEIHVKKRNRDVGKFDIGKIVESTKDFTGSEIEQIVISALFDAFDQGRDVTTDDIVNAARQTVPLAKTAREQIEGIRAWAKTRARPASKLVVEVSTIQTVGKRKLS